MGLPMLSHSLGDLGDVCKYYNNNDVYFFMDHLSMPDHSKNYDIDLEKSHDEI